MNPTIKEIIEIINQRDRLLRKANAILVEISLIEKEEYHDFVVKEINNQTDWVDQCTCMKIKKIIKDDLGGDLNCEFDQKGNLK